MRIYPYWIVEWSEGKLPVPPQYAHTPIAKMFESGRIGGRRMVETEALDVWRRNRDKDMLEVYLVGAPGTPRRRVPVQRLAQGG